MATNTTSAQELGEIRSRLEWLDEERRKLTRRLAEMEQKLTLQERELSSREQRVLQLERQVANFAAQLSRLPQVDAQLGQFKDDIVQMIEQYDHRRVQSETELDRLRRIEHEATAREIADIRKELPTIGRVQQNLELRQAEENRLAGLIGNLQNKVTAVTRDIETWEQSLAFLEEKEKQNSRNVTELQTNTIETNKRWSPIYDRLDVLASGISKLEINFQALSSAQNDIRESTRGWMEQIQIGEYERNQKLEGWRRILDEHTNAMQRFNKEWVTFSDQYKEAKMAVQTLGEWQRQVEQQQKDAIELLRVESHRMQSRWDDFLLENGKKWKTAEVETEQRWGVINRQERQVREQFVLLEEAIQKLQQEKDLIWRVQSAQTDALKQWPRIWLEEVEKAVSQNPNRRRQPALVPVPEE